MEDKVRFGKVSPIFLPKKAAASPLEKGGAGC
jgi:hypothetical protein